LFNDSKTSEETFYISYANFEDKGETGSPLFVEPINDLGTWMDAGESVTILPNESKTIPLLIRIPDDAYPGGHFAVVFFGNNTSDNNSQVTVGAKTGVLILLSVNGNVLEAGGLISFNTKDNKLLFNSLPVSMEYRWKNDGNDRVKPSGEITIRNLFYIPVAHINANSVSGNILPHSTRLFNVDWVKSSIIKDNNNNKSWLSSYWDRVYYQWKNFALGPYMATIDLAYGSMDNHSVKKIFFFVLPWQLMIIIFIILLFTFFIGRRLLRAYNRRIIEKARLSMNLDNPNHV